MTRYSLRAKRCQAAQPAGFTLIEVLLVLVILVTLGAIAVPMFSGIGERAKVQAATAQVQLFESAIDLYHTTTAQFPSGLNDLISPPSDARAAKKWAGPYLKENKNLTDPWENPYQYSAKGTKNQGSYDVWSMGPDGQSGNEDDIGNWGG